MIYRKLSELREHRNRGEIHTKSHMKHSLCVISADSEPQLHVEEGNSVM